MLAKQKGYSRAYRLHSTKTPGFIVLPERIEINRVPPKPR